MGSKSLTLLAVVAGLILANLPAQAHHSFAAEYDTKKPVELTGTVTSIEWVNPHAWIHLDVKDESGKVTSWNFELGSPNLLLRNGWRKDTIKAGDVITVSGAAAKDGSNLANAKTVKTLDGKRVFNAGSSGEPGTPGAPSAAPQQ
jgi:DNA/RNA endonuclease YhcR with UshA esterase domain